MSACCHDPACAAPDAAAAPGSRYRKVLWAALAVNAFMFAVEIGAGVRSGSVSSSPTPWISPATPPTTASR